MIAVALLARILKVCGRGMVDGPIAEVEKLVQNPRAELRSIEQNDE